ncbi:MAG: signal peptidase I [Coriobacteriia bacterium]|nr:signal peptidase I [Coriobacteriia bacterium]
MLEQPDINQPTETTREQLASGSCLIVAAHDDESDAGASPGKEVSVGRWLLELIVLVGIAFLLATGIKTWVVQPFVIPTGSMIPTLEIYDYVIANKFIYRFQDPTSGDIVVFLSPSSNSTDYIKRVIAVGGQEVDIRDGVVYVDGSALDEPYTHGMRTDPGPLVLPLIVPDSYVWLMGDNRKNSQDSRWFGPQPVSRIVGKAFFIYWPISDFGTL